MRAGRNKVKIKLVLSVTLVAMFLFSVFAMAQAELPKSPQVKIINGVTGGWTAMGGNSVPTTNLKEDDFDSYTLGRVPDFAVKSHRSQKASHTTSDNPLVLVMAVGYSDLAPVSGGFACFDFLDSYYKKGSQVYLMFVVANLEETAQNVSLSMDVMGLSKNIKWKGKKTIASRTVLLLYSKKALAATPSLYIMLAQVGKPLPANMIDFATSKFMIGNTY